MTYCESMRYYKGVQGTNDNEKRKGDTTMGTNEFTKENAHEWTELDHVYIVQDEPISGTGDYAEVK